MKIQILRFDVYFSSDLDIARVDDMYYTSNAWKKASDSQHYDGMKQPFINYLKVQPNVDKSTTPNGIFGIAQYSWWMTDSGCSATPPTYGYNSYGNFVDYYSAVKAVTVTTAFISWVMLKTLGLGYAVIKETALSLIATVID